MIEFCDDSNVMKCESKMDSMVVMCEVSCDVENESIDNLNVEESNESSTIKTLELVDDIIAIFDALWVDKNVEPTIPQLEQITQKPPNPISCQTVRYTELEISGVMLIDLPTEGVNLSIKLLLSTRDDHTLLPKSRMTRSCKRKVTRRLRPILLPSCELLEGFAHVYDPFERG